jgi:hypothetical protein
MLRWPECRLTGHWLTRVIKTQKITQQKLLSYSMAKYWLIHWSGDHRMTFSLQGDTHVWADMMFWTSKNPAKRELYINSMFSLLSLFRKNRSRLMRSPLCLCAPSPPTSTFECLNQFLLSFVCASWHLGQSQRPLHLQRVNRTKQKELIGTHTIYMNIYDNKGV